MSAANVSVNIKEVEALAKKLKGYALTSNDRYDLLSDIGTEIVEQSISRITETHTAPDGSKWKDLADSTRNYLIKQGLSGSVSLLNRSGFLHRSIKKEVQSEWSVLVGACMEYAAVHQFGAKQGEFGRTRRNGPIPWGDIPSRPYLGLSSNDIGDLADLIDAWLKEHVAA